jgi:CRISPR-associated protein Csx17
MCAVIRLEGCSATPFGSYLKGLGVFRLVSLQADSQARGWWDNNVFVLESILDQEALERFLLRDYKPTPVVAPWNGGSGFYDAEDAALNAIEGTLDERFAEYRTVVRLCRAIVNASVDAGGSKEHVLLSCRSVLPDSVVGWLDAVLVIGANGRLAFPPVLGTGGNDGNLDFSNNFMLRLASVLISPQKNTPIRELLQSSLMGVSTPGLQKGAAGQYDPGRAGGANQGQKIEDECPTNPWDFVLTIEGTVCWASGVYRRQGTRYGSYSCSPFTVKSSAVGYGSACEREATGTELWAPLWSRKMRYAELRTLLREGRASLGGEVARTGLDVAQAARSLGVDTSIDAFVRYSFVRRRGKSYVALPAGTFPVGYRDAGEQIREVGSIADQVRRAGIPKDCDALHRRLEQAMFEALLRGHKEAHRVREALAALGRLLRSAATRSEVPVPLRDTPGLHWVKACDARPEVRIAAALASAYDEDAEAIRWNLQRGRPKNANLRGRVGRFAWEGRDLSHRLISVLETRLKMYDVRESKQPFAGTVRVHGSDLTAFIESRLDDDLIEDLLFAFVCFDWSEKHKFLPQSADMVLPPYAAFKLLFFPDKIRPEPENDAERIPADPRLLPLVRAGRFADAAEIVSHRLWLAGLTPRGRRYSGVADPVRLGAALLVPAWDVRDAIAPKTLAASLQA